jgi:hypothetical protein
MMSQHGTVTLSGKSGTQYIFNAWDRADRFAATGINYVVTRFDGVSNHLIYIGETGDASSRPLNHERRDCFDRHHANMVLIRAESNSDARLEIETDLRRNYDTPCNRQ